MVKNVGAPLSAANQLAARLLDAVTDKQQELNHVARVLHENVGQLLTVVGLHLDVLRQDFGKDQPDLAARTSEIQQLLDQAIEDVRELTYRVNPDMVPRSGLRYALEVLVGGLRDSSGASIRLLIDSHAHLPLPVSEAMFRIVDQALANAVRHSGATHMEVVLQPAGREIRLEVKDNGCGFDVEETATAYRGLGILWMRHAAERAGVVLQIASKPGEGTIVQATYHPAGEPVNDDARGAIARSES
jgi:two-component system NarL family sensor kinase